MKRTILRAGVLTVSLLTGLFAQSNNNLTNFVIDKFEDAGTWSGNMPIDLGVIRVMRREGASKELRAADSNANKYVLGTKVSYFRTGSCWFTVTPPREVAIPGVTKSFSVWVAGRNLNHTLKAMYRDFNGEVRFASFGKLNFPGWQKLTAQVPTSILQEDYRVTTPDRPRGIKFMGLVVECALGETTGEYFVYFDDLSAESDTFLEDNRDPEDPTDSW